MEYDTSGNVKGLLIEEARTNLVTTSENLSGGNWFDNGGTITENAVLAPDGTLTANTFNTDGAYRILRNVVNVSSNTAYTWSFYAKNIDATDLSYRVYDNTNAADIVSATSYFSEVSTTEWTRIDVTFTTPATCTQAGVYVCSLDQGGTAAFWGAQLEAGSFATSYIPTSGATAARSADIASIDVDQFGYSKREGSVLVEFSAYSWETRADSSNYSRVWEFNGNGAGGDGVFRDAFSGDIIRYRFNENDGSTAAIGPANLDQVTGTHKVCVALGQDDAAISMDGGTVATGSGTAAMDIYSGIQIGGTGVNAMGGHIRNIKYYPRRLTNAQLQEITS